MSAPALARVLAFALVDEPFSKQLADSPDDALATIGVTLSPNERRALEDFSVTDFREAAAIFKTDAKV